jgi:hypothetical protein
MNSEKKHFVRKKLLVNPKFQLRLMLYLGLATLAGLLVMYISNDLYFDTLASQGEEIGLTRDHPYYAFIEEQRTRLDRVYLAVSVIVFTALMIFMLFLSHKIAGPIYRIETYLERVAAGDEHMAPVTLREGDFFPEIAGIVNNVIAHFSDEKSDKDDRSQD